MKDFSVSDWNEKKIDTWSIGEWCLHKKHPPQREYGFLNFEKGRFWEKFVEHELGFKEWHLGGERWNKQDPRTEEQKSLDKNMLEVTNLNRKTKYDGVKKQEELDSSLAKEVAEFKLRGSSGRREQTKLQAEDLAIESKNKKKPCRINYYFFEKPSEKKIKSILEIYENACKKHLGSKIEVLFHCVKTDKQILEESKKNPPNPKQN